MSPPGPPASVPAPAAGPARWRSDRHGLDGRAVPIRVLLVEDEVADARLFLEAFRDLDLPAEVVTVPTGAEALQHLQGPASRPDVVFLDLNLPRKDGRQVLAEIRGDTALAALPVVVVTSSRQDADVLHAFDFHAEGYLRKPVEPASLRELLGRLDLLR
jgi:chemotaxis family two-component system response regulator Rcp1